MEINKNILAIESVELPTQEIDVDEMIASQLDDQEHHGLSLDEITSKEDLINRRLFKKTNDAKYIRKHGESYEKLAENILFLYMQHYHWSASFDKKDKTIYIINMICAENIPCFSLVGIKDFQEFNNLVLAAAKKILVEENMDRIIDDEEFNSRMLRAHNTANEYKDK